MEEVYIIINSKSKDIIEHFLKNYAKDFEQEQDLFHYPQYTDVEEYEFETSKYEKMLDFVLNGEDKVYRFYLKNRSSGEIKKARIFINQDNSLILGLVVSSSNTNKYINLLESDYNSSKILVTWDIMPPDNYNSFIKLFEQYKSPKKRWKNLISSLFYSQKND